MLVWLLPMRISHFTTALNHAGKNCEYIVAYELTSSLLSSSSSLSALRFSVSASPKGKFIVRAQNHKQAAVK